MSLEKLQRFRDAAKPYKVRLPWNDFANLIAVAEAAEAIESMLEGHPEEDSWPVTRVGPLMAAVSRLKRA